MNKKLPLVLIIVVIVVLLILAFTGHDSEEPSENGLRIVTTIYPYEILVRELISERGEVTSFIPPDASPHTYSPNPRDMQMLERGDLVISNGLGLEMYLDNFLDSITGRHISAADFLSELEENEQGNHQTHNHGINPHIWLDPVLLSKIVEGISLKLQEIDPDYRDYYWERNQLLQRKFSELNEKISAQREDLDKISIISFHDAFHYFNQRYNINSVATVVQSPGKEPTPRELIELGGIIQENNVRVILIEPQLNPKAAELIASEHDIKLLIVDPLGSYWQVDTIDDLIIHYWDAIREFSEDSR